MTDEKVTLLHRWFDEVWNKRRIEAIDEMRACEAVAHGLTDESGSEVSDSEGFKAFYRKFCRTFPDLHFEIEDTVVEGDLIAARCRVHGTHQRDGLFDLAATGKAVEFTGISMVRVKDGKIVEAWNNFDFFSVYQQLKGTNLLV